MRAHIDALLLPRTMRGVVTRSVHDSHMSIEPAASGDADVTEIAELYQLATLAYRNGRQRGESPDAMRRLRLRMDLAFLLWRNVSGVRVPLHGA